MSACPRSDVQPPPKSASDAYSNAADHVRLGWGFTSEGSSDAVSLACKQAAHTLFMFSRLTPPLTGEDRLLVS